MIFQKEMKGYMKMKKQLIAAGLLLIILFSIGYSASADMAAVDYYTYFKKHDIEKYYTNLGKWFSMMSDLQNKDHITKPEQSDFKTLNRFLIDNVKSAVDDSADESAEFWAMIFDVDNKDKNNSDVELFNGIINDLKTELSDRHSSITAVSDSFTELYGSVFADNQISQSEYKRFLAGICTLNDIIQEILRIDSAQDSSQTQSP